MALGIASLLLLFTGFHQNAAAPFLMPGVQILAGSQTSSASATHLPPAVERVALFQPATTASGSATVLTDGRASKPASNTGNAGEADTLAGIFIPEPARPTGPFKSGPDVVRRSRNSWLALTVAQHAAATFDAWSSRRAINRKGIYETDPLMRPFVHSSTMYGMIQLGPAALEGVAVGGERCLLIDFGPLGLVSGRRFRLLRAEEDRPEIPPRFEQPLRPGAEVRQPPQPAAKQRHKDDDTQHAEHQPLHPRADFLEEWRQ